MLLFLFAGAEYISAARKPFQLQDNLTSWDKHLANCKTHLKMYNKTIVWSVAGPTCPQSALMAWTKHKKIKGVRPTLLKWVWKHLSQTQTGVLVLLLCSVSNLKWLLQLIIYSADFLSVYPSATLFIKCQTMRMNSIQNSPFYRRGETY